MIKLSRYPKPGYLSDEKVIELVKQFKANKKSVWNVDQIKTPLLASSYGKCAYCEICITEESKYMEVEHFECKSHNPDKVVTWDNLLPSCKRCNGCKFTHNVLAEPIVNPYNDEPVIHFYIRHCRLKGLTDEGKKTIAVIKLNDFDRLVKLRLKIADRIDEAMKDAEMRYGAYRETGNVKYKDHLITLIKRLLDECQPTEIYAATTATLLFSNNYFIALIKIMQDEELWNGELTRRYLCASLLVFREPQERQTADSF